MKPRRRSLVRVGAAGLVAVVTGVLVLEQYTFLFASAPLSVSSPLETALTVAAVVALGILWMTAGTAFEE